MQQTEIFKTLQAIQSSIPAQVLLQKPIIFLDALGRQAPIHLEWVDSYEAFLAVLKVRFKHHGLQLIKDNCFVVRATKQRHDVDFNKPWNSCVFPGQGYDMSMLFQGLESASSVICVGCRRSCVGNAGEEITWFVTTSYFKS